MYILTRTINLNNRLITFAAEDLDLKKMLFLTYDVTLITG